MRRIIEKDRGMKNGKIVNCENIDFVLGELSDGERDKREIEQRICRFCAQKGVIMRSASFTCLINAMTWNFPLYESDDGLRIGLLKKDGADMTLNEAVSHNRLKRPAAGGLNGF